MRPSRPRCFAAVAESGSRDPRLTSPNSPDGRHLGGWPRSSGSPNSKCLSRCRSIARSSAHGNPSAPHKGRTPSAVCSDLALGIRLVRRGGSVGMLMDPAVLDPHRTAASSSPLGQDTCLRSTSRRPMTGRATTDVQGDFVHHSLAHGHEDEMGDRDIAGARARIPRRRRHHRDRESTRQPVAADRGLKHS